MSAMSLEERIKRLEDIEAIKDLMSRYAFYINKGWNGREVDIDKMALIFTVDATWESRAMKLKAVGLEELMRGLRAATERNEFSMHSFTNPIIEVDGDEAKGNWLMWIASKRNGSAPNEVFMSEDLTYVRTERGWRIKTVELHFGMMLTEVDYGIPDKHT
jgi:hypothetical protein